MIFHSNRRKTIGGFISGGVIDGLEGVGGIRGWRWLFISTSEWLSCSSPCPRTCICKLNRHFSHLVEGLITILASIIVVFFLPDWPSNTKWLSEDEKGLAVRRLEIDQIENGASTADSTKLSHRQALAAAGKDWRTYLFCFMCESIDLVFPPQEETFFYFIKEFNYSYNPFAKKKMKISCFLVHKPSPTLSLVSLFH
jgi:hypothetical protein